MEKYRVMNTFPGEENGRHEYDIHVEETDRGTKYSLIRSQAGHWAEQARGETVCAILDDGDGYKLSKHISRDMGYDTMAELYVLMAFINAQGNTNCFFMGTIEEVKTVLEI